MKNKYSYIFADEYHQNIRTLEELTSKWDILSLFFNENALGKAYLRLLSKRYKTLQTECVELKDEYRYKGHGIHLYFALIRAAKNLGATKIQSSRYLNRFSRKMWKIKLAKYFDVTAEIGCNCKCWRCRKNGGYYSIDLTGLELKNIPI